MGYQLSYISKLRTRLQCNRSTSFDSVTIDLDLVAIELQIAAAESNNSGLILIFSKFALILYLLHTYNEEEGILKNYDG